MPLNKENQTKPKIMFECWTVQLMWTTRLITQVICLLWQKFCIEPVTLFSWTYNKRMVHQCATIFQNTPQDLNSEFLLLQYQLPYQG